jgi:hypothetical protein
VKHNYVRSVVFSLGVGVMCAISGAAQVTVAPQPGNKLSVSASVTVTQDPSSGLYTYSYTFKNSASSSQSMWFLALDLSGDAQKSIQNIQPLKAGPVSPRPASL